MKRIKIVPDRPNRQFETWLEEWRDHAMLRNSELCGQFTKALDSLKRYPLPLESGKECIILQHFGTKLCSMLDKKLEEQRRHESVKTIVDADCITASRKQLLDDKVVETQEKTARVRQARNTKQSAPKKLANIDEIASKENGRQIYLESNAFDIILLVDTQETCGGKTKPQHDATLMELTQFGVLFEVRRLKIGDFMWIARCRKTQDELVIPYIIERKRMDDLSASITDGRFHEQKFRLKQSKIENLMYIVENIDKNSRFSIPLPSLLQASVNCLIQDGFTVKYTRNHKDSMSYLSCVTKTLIKIYKDKKLVGCKKERLLQTNNLDSTIRLMEFKEFNKASSKQRKFKVSEMFIRQLLQLKGMSVDRATAIVERYPSPQILIIALENSVNGEQLLANIQVGDKKRQLGSSIIYTTMGLSVYIFITILPQILDVFLPLNETRSREHPFRMEFFIDEEKFFYLIRIQMYLIIILMMVTILANGTVFVVYTRHASGMFTILGNRAEHLFSERSSKFGRSNRRTEKEYRNIVLFVEDHRNVIQFVDVIRSSYSLSLFGEYLFFMIVIGLTLVQVQNILNLQFEKKRTLRRSDKRQISVVERCCLDN
ncbi:crossover junction endonuclease MUS81 isoform X3 [Camponotus floridanus]|uniref:crossover junction endonuclease MUS81 isoform X3 n=1 Tax=Camponotus floridanus TaxID=104421 RepID=UPI000DC67EAA|nr:crossover junction endonuclease MUS81 isoform X3 [Camponotus floridanus]